MAQSIINVGPRDAQLTLNTQLPAGGANITTGILDMSAISPNSRAWKMGRIAVIFPNMPENTVAGGITVTMQVAPPSLTNSLPAPAAAVPGVFITPQCSQVVTIPGVVGTGSAAAMAYFTLAFDPTGSTYEFYQFIIAVTAGINTQNENIEIAWIKDGE